MLTVITVMVKEFVDGESGAVLLLVRDVGDVDDVGGIDDVDGLD